MKKTFLLSIAIVLLGLGSFAQWTPQSSNLTTSTLTSVYFSDINNGHAVGFGPEDPPMPYLNTTNEGAIWTSVGLTGIDVVKSVYFTNINTGYAAGMVSGTDQHYGIIQKTTDEGITWTTVFTGNANSNFSSLCFADTFTGYVVGDGGDILKTNDCGTTWTPQISGTTSPLMSVYFTDTNTGYVIGMVQGSPASGFILKTDNGGATWTTKYSNGNQFFSSVFFTDNNTGYAAGYNIQVGLEAAVILKTIDGGASWTAQYYPTIDWLNSVYFANANTGYVVGNYGAILKTNDAGSTWVTQASGTTNSLTSVFFIDSNIGYTVGGNGTILKTTNGGVITGIIENQKPGSLNIYPNPATDQIIIETSESGSNLNGTISLYGMAGHELIQKQVQGSRSEINVSALPNGIYFVRLIYEENIEFGQFIKE
jgi:photosystem II stability/assembly factor-like uncharacterized protein